MMETVQLGDIVKLRKGRKAVDVNEHMRPGLRPYIQIGEVRGAIPQKFASDPNGIEVFPDDLCIVWDGANAGTVGFGVEGLIGSTVARMRVTFPNSWDTPFIGRLLQSKFQQLNEQAHARGATIPHVDKSRLEAVSLPRINKNEQRRIAVILDKADGLRRKCEQALEMIDEAIESSFLKLFGDPAQNPRGWREFRMGEIGLIQGGLQVSKKRDQLPLRRPYLRVANVFRDRLQLEEMKQIGLTSAEFNRVKLHQGDVLIVEGHGNPYELGRASVWDGSIADCVHQNHLIRFRANSSVVLPEYISRMLNSEGGRRQLIAAGRTTSGLNTISTKKVKEVVVPSPPIDLQEHFVALLGSYRRLFQKIESERVEVAVLFQSLSQRAFRGEL